MDLIRMGLTYHDAKRLRDARLAGRCFDHLLTIGRLRLFLHPHEARSLPLPDYRFGEFADRFYPTFLAARRVDMLDFSDYEGATVAHDLNQPVPAAFYNQYDAVIEAGSLEHIFHFPTAMANLMRMVRPGGDLYITTVANNLCGHGFYQFSPELIYRIFTPENGFDPPRVVFLEGTYPWIELTPTRALYEVADPAQVGRRVALQSNHPIMMMVDAHKTADVEPFRTIPQQSDYVVKWSGAEANGSASLAKRAFRALPETWQRRLRAYRSLSQNSLNNTAFYRKVS